MANRNLRNRKAQFSLEYYVSLLTFVIFVTYLLFQIQILTPAHLREIRMQTLRLEAFQVSELLLNDGGEPNDWHLQSDANIKRIGLSSSSSQNLLSVAKVAALDSKCKNSGFISLYNWLGMQNQFHLTARDTTGTLVDTEKNCPPSSEVGTQAVVVTTRVVTFDSGKTGNLTLTVW